jgi:hypothetical protein
MMRLHPAVSRLAAASLLAVFAGAGVSTAGAATRTATLSLNPAAGDVELAELEFPRRQRQSISAATLAVAALGPFGQDYLAVATPRRRPHGELVALVLLVNRPTATPGPATVRISVRSSRSLGSFAQVRLRDPFTGRRWAPAPRRVRSELPCAVPSSSGVLHASDLRVLGRARGTALTGFTPAAAVAAAYDALCTASDSSAFRRAVQGSGAPPPPPPPPPAPGPPSPGPPVPGPPRCAPCSPTPGVACPLAAVEAVCVLGRDETAPSVAAGAY